MKLRSALVLCTLAFGGCTSTQPAVSTAYYDVQGTTALHLDRSIRHLGPNDGHAIAAAEIRFVPVSLRKAEDKRGCRVAEARIKVVANVTLPRWRNRSGSTEELKQAFDSMARYAKLHEAVHVEIADGAAREMEAELLSLPPQKTCALLEKRADAVIRQVRTRHDRAQKAFDAAEQKRLKKLFEQAGS